MPVVTSKKAAFELPPPGVGLATVTEAVLGLAISEARIFAFNSELLTKIVVRALPFHLTTEPKIKPVPLTVSVNPAPPGLIASGTSGWLIKGIGFAVPVVALSFRGSCAATRTGTAIAANNVIALMYVDILDFTVLLLLGHCF